MLRVLNIVPALNYCGGIENYAMAYYRHIDREKVQFDFITHTDLSCSFQEEIEAMGGRIYKFPKFKIKNFIKLNKIITEFFCEHREYKIIHCHMANAAFMYFPIAMKYGIKVRIIHSHNTKYADKISHAIRNRFLVDVGLRFATHRIACTKKAGDFLFKKNDYEIIKNAIDCENFAYKEKIRNKMRKMYGVEDRIVLGNIARFVPQKNHIFMIEILRKLLCIDARYMLCFVGEGELLLRIKEAARDIKDHVLFVGVQQNVEDYYNMFDIFILPSIYEGLGIVNIEAQCSGLPVMVSDAVPYDVKVTNLIEFLPLEKNIWVNKIVKHRKNGNERTDHSKSVELAGYDIKNESKKLMKMYERFIDKGAEA